MSTPKYLTGDKAGIDEFVDKFDVRTSNKDELRTCADVAECRPSSSTAMVRPPTHDVDVVGEDEADDTRRTGVLWSGETLFKAIPETISMLRKKGKRNISEGEVGAAVEDDNGGVAGWRGC